jgi:hypothetical protein
LVHTVPRSEHVLTVGALNQWLRRVAATDDFLTWLLGG